MSCAVVHQLAQSPWGVVGSPAASETLGTTPLGLGSLLHPFFPVSRRSFSSRIPLSVVALYQLHNRLCTSLRRLVHLPYLVLPFLDNTQPLPRPVGWVPGLGLVGICISYPPAPPPPPHKHTLQDLDTLQQYSRTTLALPEGVSEGALSTSGHNWGGVQLRGASLAFLVGGKVAFELPLPDVCTAQQTKVGGRRVGWGGWRGGREKRGGGVGRWN